MRRCSALRGSRAILTRACHQSQQQFAQCFRPYASSASHHHDLRPPNTTSTPPRRTAQAAPNLTPPARDDEAMFPVDTNAKTITTAVGELPLSPVMDPSFWESRERFKKPKPKPGRPANQFERLFRVNPYAKALATPVRHDSVSWARLPAFFLQEFKLLADPDTGGPWWVPRSIMLNGEDGEGPKDRAVVDEHVQEKEAGASKDASIPKIARIEPAGSNKAAERKESRSIYGPSAHALARQDVLESFTVPTSGYYNFNRRLFGQTTSRYTSLSQKAMWRKDMPDFVLDQMRQRVVRDILYLSKLCVENERYYIVKCFGWDDVQYKHKGAVLWFEDPDDERNGGAQEQPGLFATFDTRTEEVKTSVPVHNLPQLLGDEYAGKLRKEARVFDDGAIFMLAGRRSTDLQLKLWKLQGYLADYRDPST